MYQDFLHLSSNFQFLYRFEIVFWPIDPIFYVNPDTHKFLLVLYLKGQKIIYMESKCYTEQHLNRLMMPAIMLSTSATVLASILRDYIWGAIIISSVNGIISFLLALVNFFKLDAASEAHKISAHQYDKLQSTVEFTSGSILLFKNFRILNSPEDNKNEQMQITQSNNDLSSLDIQFELNKNNNNNNIEL